MKNKFKGIGIWGVVFGTWLSRNFGVNGRVLIGLACAVLILPALIILILKKAYFESFLFLLLILPLVVAFIGIYYDNVYFMLGGLITFFIALFVLKRYGKNKDDNIDYEKYKNN